MRFFLALLLITGLTACSSGPKTESTTNNTTPTPTAPSPGTGAPTAADKKAPKRPAKTGASSVDCESKGDTRKLEVREKDKGCELAYTKGGQEAIVATSVNGKSHCQSTLEKIQGRLNEAGFSCK